MLHRYLNVEHHKIIIIGAGAMGSAAAYQLAQQGEDVMLLEQFKLLHDQGSSHGDSRVIRRTYTSEYFANMMTEAYSLWEELEEETGEKLYTKTGGLDFGHRNNKDLQKTIEVAERMDVDHMIMDENMLKTRFPAFNFEKNTEGLYQKDTGILNATKTLHVLQAYAAQFGAKIKDEIRITDIFQEETIVVKTDQGDFSAEKLIITTGSWINQILSLFYIQVDVSIWHICFGYFRPSFSELFKIGKFPVFIDWDDEIFYGFPINEKEGLIKIAPHISKEITKLDHRDESIQPSEKLIDHLKNYVATRLDRVDIIPEEIESCYYTMTDTENFIIDFIPDNKDIIVAGGFSGHGFKFVPLIGKILADLAIKGESKWALDQFKLHNFMT